MDTCLCDAPVRNNVSPTSVSPKGMHANNITPVLCHFTFADLKSPSFALEKARATAEMASGVCMFGLFLIITERTVTGLDSTLEWLANADLNASTH